MSSHTHASICAHTHIAHTHSYTHTHTYTPRRCLWCNGYRRRKWTRRHKFKFWTRPITFPIALIPLRPIILPPAMSGFFGLRQLVEEKENPEFKPAKKNWPCVISCPCGGGLVNTCTHIHWYAHSHILICTGPITHTCNFSLSNGYGRWKWTRRPEFKSWTRLFAFRIALIPLGKVWI